MKDARTNYNIVYDIKVRKCRTYVCISEAIAVCIMQDFAGKSQVNFMRNATNINCASVVAYLLIVE